MHRIKKILYLYILGLIFIPQFVFSQVVPPEIIVKYEILSDYTLRPYCSSPDGGIQPPEVIYTPCTNQVILGNINFPDADPYTCGGSVECNGGDCDSTSFAENNICTGNARTALNYGFGQGGNFQGEAFYGPDIHWYKTRFFHTPEAVTLTVILFSFLETVYIIISDNIPMIILLGIGIYLIIWITSKIKKTLS